MLLTIWSDAVRSATDPGQLLSVMRTIEGSPVFQEKDNDAELELQRGKALETIEWIKMICETV